MSLLAMAIEAFGVSARSFTGSQAGIITDTVHGKARILDVTPERVREALDAGHGCHIDGAVALVDKERCHQVLRCYSNFGN
jgi:aspartate kinase